MSYQDYQLLEAKAVSLTSQEIERFKELFATANPSVTNSMYHLCPLYNEKLARAKQSCSCGGCRNKVYKEVEYCIKHVW